MWLRLDATPREVDETGSTVTRMTLTDVSEAQRTARLITRLLRMRDAAEEVAHGGHLERGPAHLEDTLVAGDAEALRPGCRTRRRT